MFSIEIQLCPFVKDYYSSKHYERWRKIYLGKPSCCLWYAFNWCGRRSVKKLCCFMNMAEPIGNEIYDNTADTSVSVDVTSQKKGFVSSLAGVTALSVDSGKIFDVSIMLNACKVYTSMEL